MKKFLNAKSIVTLVMLALMVLPQLALAAGPTVAMGTFTCATAGTSIVSFFESVEGLVGVASVIIVTIAIIFAGYQVAFAHKRISDVAPILVGGVMIGAAGAVATMLVGSGVGAECK